MMRLRSKSSRLLAVDSASMTLVSFMDTILPKVQILQAAKRKF